MPFSRSAPGTSKSCSKWYGCSICAKNIHYGATISVNPTFRLDWSSKKPNIFLYAKNKPSWFNSLGESWRTTWGNLNSSIRSIYNSAASSSRLCTGSCFWAYQLLAPSLFCCFSFFFINVALLAIMTSKGIFENGIFELGKICIMLNCIGKDDFWPLGRNWIQPIPYISWITKAKFAQSITDNGLSMSIYNY